MNTFNQIGLIKLLLAYQKYYIIIQTIQKEVQKMKKPLLVLFVFCIIFSFFIPSFSQQSGSIEIEVKYINGDRVDFNEVSLVIFQDNNKTPLMKKSLTKNPEIIESLAIGHRYKIETYVNNIYGSTTLVDLKVAKQQVDVFVPLSGGLQLAVFFNDGQTPIEGATIKIKTQDGTQLRESTTNSLGQSLRHWIQSTSRDEDYYKADIFLGDLLIFTQTPIKVQPGIAQNLKVIAPIPPKIQDLITISVLKDGTKVTKQDGEFFVGLYNKENKVVESFVNYRGDSFFSNIKVGKYIAKVIKKGQDVVAEKEIILDGNKKNFEILIPSLSTQPQDTIPTVPQETSQESKPSCQCVAFRLDNIQDFWLNDVQIQTIKVFYEEDVPLTLGIVVGAFGSDQQLVSYIKSLDKNKITLAINGWSNEDIAKLTKQEQVELIKKSKDKILQITGLQARVFVPKFNSFNQDTLQAVQENGIKYFSATTSTDLPPYYFDQSLVRIPAGVETGQVSNNVVVGQSGQKIFERIEANIASNGFAMVLAQPQEFSIVEASSYQNKLNQTQIDDLKSLLEQIRAKNIKIVGLTSIPNSFTIDVPDWIRNNAGWWAQGTIGDSDFVKGLEYLVNKKIINVSQVDVESQNDKSIPSWIKNNADWWAKGQISDKDFVNGIEYMIKKGIIVVR
jgi:hypothetical protein